jgi:heavy metal sensor kinase
MRKPTGFMAFLHSIRFRLVLWFTAILALVLFSFSAFIYYSQMRDIRGDALFRLESKMNSIEVVLSSSLNSPISLQSTDVFILLDNDGRVLASQGVASQQDMLDLVRNAQQAQQQKSDHEAEPIISWTEKRNSSTQQYIFVIKPVTIAGRPSGYAILGNSVDPYDLNSRLLTTLILGSLLTLAIAVGGGLWLADRAMRPVHSITQAARTISETDLNHRLNMNSKDELGELANTFDGMLARLQAAFERQRQFVADASHELRTPLTIINLEASRALSSKRSSQEYQRTLGVIHSENEFMSHLVNDLLALSRMDSGQLVLEKKLLDLSDIALDAVERLAPLAERKNVSLETGSLPEVNIHGDRQYLLQMVSNLVENGINYMSGDVRIVKVETGVDKDAAWVRISDTGAGIPPEYLPHLFDRFYRVDKARTRNEDEETSGIGLGLSIVQWIAQAHGGTVHVESVVGTGTTFEVRFGLGRQANF